MRPSSLLTTTAQPNAASATSSNDHPLVQPIAVSIVYCANGSPAGRTPGLDEPPASIIAFWHSMS